MKAFVILAGVLATLYGAGVLVWDFTRPLLPVSRVIKNSEGKELDVVIQGKSGETLIVDRVSDGGRYNIAVRSLSLNDRIFAMRLLNQKAPKVPDLPPEPAKPEAPFIARRLESIEELRRKAKVYKSEIQSRDPKDTLYNLRLEQLATIDREIKALEMSIETYKYQVLKE